MRSFIRKIIREPKSDTQKLLDRAVQFPRYTPTQFSFRGMKLQVTDFISVAWQLKEFFDDERLKFISSPPSPLVLDCGSNVGVSVLYFKSIFPLAKIIAFEPDEKVVQCLKTNLLSNNIKDVTIIEKAVWKDNNGVSFGREGADGGSVFFDGQKVTLPSIRLKDLLAQHSSIDLLKMDIEGAETVVLQDASTDLSKIKNLFVEYHSWINQPQNLQTLLSTLTENGFRYYINSIGEIQKQPFMKREFSNRMDVQLDIYAINQRH